MEDIEIYNLTVEVITSIVGDINESTYSDLNGTLSVSWIKEKKFNAWASSDFKIGQPPVHKIGIHYELARQLYRDIEEYCAYMEKGNDKELFDAWFSSDPNYLELLPSSFSNKDYQHNIFMAGLTWVLFHEIGHLNQEHGIIRDSYCEPSNNAIHECDVENEKNLKGKAAAIFHATEMAADFEAVNKCIFELSRHFEGKELEGAVKFFVCGLCCVLYRFHGAKSFLPSSKPEGTHPNPLIRLETMLPQIFETLDLPNVRNSTKLDLAREDLVYICTQMATTVGVFWLRTYSEGPEVPDGFFLEGTMNKDGVKDYMRIIINTWDEIEEEIKCNKHFGPPLGLLQFSDEYRELIFQD
ncbi:hypothetical protein [Aliivibrio fischeri]|uniref:hypothetical protein n=1 Tax=Aliivibrio fischeri TaxID=668 RepID=UPI0007C5C497|nr:hypothetical protein [Aliivibrio fischeri]